jgi:NTP pyrophosphatase (non-canonical NTP hydrolase)
MTLKQLCKISHKLARLKGFWGDYGKDLTTYKDYYVKDRNISEMLMLTVSELGEACNALRKNNLQHNAGAWRKDTFEDEIADTFIRLADMCEALDIDIDWQIKKKLQYNRTRPYKHGKAF